MTRPEIVLSSFAPTSIHPPEVRIPGLAVVPADPIEGPLTPRPGEVDWDGTWRTMYAHGTPLSRVGLTLAIWMAWLAPLWMKWKLATLGSRSPAERASILAAMSRHRLYAVRELTLLLKIAASMALLGVPSVRERSAYDRAPEPPLARLGEARP